MMSYCRIKHRLELRSEANSSELYFIKERRHTAKLLIIVLRDFSKVLTGNKHVSSLESMMSSVWQFSLQNLVYILPYFEARVLCPADDHIQCENEEIEFQACIAQILSLMSTIATIHPQVRYFTENVSEVLYLLVGYCLLGDETEKLFQEDKNAFLTAFLDDSAEMMISVSIRMSVVSLLEECYFQSQNFDRI